MEKVKVRRILGCAVMTIAFLVRGSLHAKSSEKSLEVKVHPKIIQGALGNGIRYMLLPNPKPENRLSLRLFVNAGALMEEDHEDGLAHFIEHMVFNGSNNFPAGTLIKYFQRIGMGFGNDLNASTSLSHTAYKLELPSNGEDDIRQALTVLRDYANGALFLPEEIDRERGVILSELRTRESPAMRAHKAESAFIFQNHLLSKRFVIGEKETINNFAQKDFFSFYNRWYTPGRMCVVMVGPMDVSRVIAQIHEKFGDLKKSPCLKDPNLGSLPQPTKLQIGLMQEPELLNASIEFVAYKPLKDTCDTELRRKQDLVMDAIKIMLDRRWEKLMKVENSPILGAGFLFASMLATLDISAFEFTCNADKWPETLELLEKEVRKANKFGFLPEEIDLAKKELQCQFENEVKASDTDLSSVLADEIVETLAHKRVYTSAEQELDFFVKNKDFITNANCLKALNEFWETPKFLWIAGNFKDPITSEAVSKVYQKSLKTPVYPPEELAKKSFAYNDFGPAGTVKSVREVPELDTKCIQFENNVRLTLKKTAFSKNEILVQVRVGSGFLEIASAQKPGLDTLASVSFISGGLMAHDITEIKRIFAGKTVGANGIVADDAFIFSALTTQEDLRDQLNLLCAYLCYPGFRNEALTEFRKNLETLYRSFTHTASGVFAQKGLRYLTNGDERFGYAEKSVLEQRDFKELAEVLKPILSKGYIEICLVGDLDPEKAIKEVSETFGALPMRAESKERLEDARKVGWPQPSETAYFHFDSNIPKAVVQVYWPTEDAWNVSNVRRLQVLKELLENRIIFEIREKLGEIYSPQVDSISSDTFTGRGTIKASIGVAPDKAALLLTKIVEIGQHLATHKVEDDEFQRAVNPIFTQVKDSLKTNAYWMSCFSNAQEYPTKLTWPTTMLSEYQAITAEEVYTFAQKYLTPERAIKIILSPQN